MVWLPWRIRRFIFYIQSTTFGYTSDGQHILFSWLEGDEDRTSHLMFHDIQSGQSRDISSPEGFKFDVGGGWWRPISDMSNNGRYIAFIAYTEEDEDKPTLFLHDTQADHTELILTVNNPNGLADPGVSDDGSLITFVSDADNLVSGDSNHESDVFVYERTPHQESGANDNLAENPGILAPTLAPSLDIASNAPLVVPTITPVALQTTESTILSSSNLSFFLMGGLGLLFVSMVAAGVFLFSRRGRNVAVPPAPAKTASAPPQAVPVPPPPVPIRQPKFCIKCGAPLQPNAQFCITCGTTVAQPPPPPPPAPTPDLLSQGIAQVKANQLAAGIQTLRQVVGTSPDNATAWFWLGIAFAKQNNKTAAQQCLQKAQALGHPQAAKALAKVQQL